MISTVTAAAVATPITIPAIVGPAPRPQVACDSSAVRSRPPRISSAAARVGERLQDAAVIERPALVVVGDLHTEPLGEQPGGTDRAEIGILPAAARIPSMRASAAAETAAGYARDGDLLGSRDAVKPYAS